MVRASDYPYFDAPGPIGLAHRGGAGHAPNRGRENSLAAFREAVDLGYGYLETDVHATRDGVLVAFHDDRLDRVTDGSGLLADLPWSVVRQARIAGREEIPTLDAVLEELPEVRVNIDVKAPGGVEPLARVIRAHGAVGRVCVASFSERRVRAVRRLVGPRLATAAGPVGVAVSRFTPGALAGWVRSTAPVLQVPVRHRVAGVDVTLVTQALLRRLHRVGKHVHVWTVDDPGEMHRLLDLGVDGIVSDRIDLLRDVLADRGTPLGR